MADLISAAISASDDSKEMDCSSSTAAADVKKFRSIHCMTGCDAVFQIPEDEFGENWQDIVRAKQRSIAELSAVASTSSSTSISPDEGVGQVEGVNRLFVPEYFRCPGDSKCNHVYCLPCFSQMVRADSDSWATGKIPMHCMTCSRLWTDNLIRQYLLNPHLQKEYEAVWNHYERALIRVGLLDAVRKEANVPIACNRCHFTALYPANYRQRANKLKKWVAQQNEQDEKEKETKMEEKSNKTTHIVSACIEISGDVDNKMEISDSTANSSKSSSAAPIPSNDEIASKADCDSMEELPPNPSLNRQSSNGLSLTSLFFECQTPKCGGLLCLVCEKYLKDGEKDTHSCDANTLHEFYLRFLEVLANSSKMKCPKCSWDGQIDEACSHIFCNACRNHWCYMCGKYQDLNAEGWNVHNEWSFVNPIESHCPMYLRQRFGGGTINSSTHLFQGGDAKEARRLFHVDRQQQATERFKSSLTADELKIFYQMLDHYFPNGPLDLNDVTKLMDVNEKVEKYRANYIKEQERKKKEEEEKKEKERKEQEERKKLQEHYHNRLQELYTKIMTKRNAEKAAIAASAGSTTSISLSSLSSQASDADVGSATMSFTSAADALTSAAAAATTAAANAPLAVQLSAGSTVAAAVAAASSINDGNAMILSAPTADPVPSS